MNYVSIWRLVRKDLYYFRWTIVGTLLFYAILISMLLFRSFPPLSANMTIGLQTSALNLVAMLFVTVGLIFTTQTVLRDRIDKLNVFVMSLPVSQMEYDISKLIMNGLVFGVGWLGAFSAAATMIMIHDDIPNGLVPLVILVGVQSLAALMLLMPVALIARTQGGLFAAFLVGHVYFLFVSPKLFDKLGVTAAASSDAIAWPAPLVVMLLGTIVLIGVIVAVTRSVLLSKRDVI